MSASPSVAPAAALRRTVSLGLVLAALAGGTAVIGASAVSAQDKNPIAERQAMMKAWARAAKLPGAMLKGQADFDLKAVKAALQLYADDAKRLPALFPDDSKTGHDTHAKAAIWEDKAAFDGLAAKFGTDAEANLAAITDEASFKARFPQQLGDCGTCHKQFRERD